MLSPGPSDVEEAHLAVRLINFNPLACVTCLIQLGFEGSALSGPHSYPLMIIQLLFGTWDRMAGSSTHVSASLMIDWVFDTTDSRVPQIPSALATTLSQNGLCHSYKSLNIAYKDIGLFGLYLVGPPKSMPAAVEVNY